MLGWQRRQGTWGGDELSVSSRDVVQQSWLISAVCPFLQSKFHMHVKALEYVGGQHVCSLPERDRHGVIHVKPTSLSDSLTVSTAVVCDVCPCEQVGACTEGCSSGQPGVGMCWLMHVGPARPPSDAQPGQDLHHCLFPAQCDVLW